MADEEEAKRQRKAAKRAAKEAAAAAAVEEEEEVDEAEAKRQRKAAKKAAKEAAAAAAEEEVDEAEAKRQRKAAKRAAKEAAAAAAAEEEEEIDEAEAKRRRKAAKKAAKEAAAAEDEEAAPRKAKKAKEAAEAEEAEEAPEAATAATDDTVPRVFIKGLPYSADEAQLRADFAECGEITKLQLPMDPNGQPKGFAFIQFATRKGFDAAMEYDNTEYGGRYINVSEAMPDKGSGKGKAGKAGKAADWTCPSCGDLVFARNNACRSCGAERPGGAGGGGGGGGGDAKGKGRAGDWDCPKCGDLVFGRNNSCRQCGAERPGGPVAASHDHENTVFIRGLPWSAAEADLRKDFAECGEIENLRMPMNGEGKPAGIAFIKFTSAEGVEAALKFDNTEYGGRSINVLKSGEVAPKGKGKGKDGAGKGKDKGKGKGKGKSKAPSASFAKSTGCIVAGAGAVTTFDDSDDE